MNRSAQAIVIDRTWKLYFEDNFVTGMLSFIGWKCEGKETFLETVIREVHEELGIIFSPERFLDGQIQPVRTFWNERKQQYIDWLSEYFVLVLQKEDISLLRPSAKLIILENISQLDSFPDEKFFPLGRDVFLAQVNRALKHIC